MAQLPQTFTSKVVEPSGSYTQLPIGDYPTIINGSEMKAVKDKPDCGYLELSLLVIDGEHKGATTNWKLNLYHTGEPTSEQTRAIAERNLSAVAHVTGNTDASGRCTATDSVQFHNIPFITVVGPQKNKPEFTQVVGVKNIDGSAPGQKGSAPAAAPAAPPQIPVAPPVAAPAQWGQPAAPVEAAPAQPAWGAPAATTAPAASPPWAVKP